jgi:hypothetical protein
MKLRQLISIVLVVSVLATGPAGVRADAPEAGSVGAKPELDWLAGNWISCRGDSYVEERWLGPSRGILVGAMLTHGTRRTSFEYARIAPSADGTYVFHAQPAGRPQVEFRLVPAAAGHLVFENRAHDFPQRIIYWREGEALHARVEGLVRGTLESEEWQWRALTR